jgi:hypothetical protein
MSERETGMAGYSVVRGGLASLVGRPDEAFIGPLVPTFGDGGEENGLTPRVEGVGDPPFGLVHGHAQLLHVAVCRAFQRVRMGAPELGTRFCEQPGISQDGVLYGGSQGLQLQCEAVIEQDVPHRSTINASL